MVSPCITLNGNAADALDFYESIFETSNKKVMRYSDAPPMPGFDMPPEQKDWIMHSEITICGTVFNLSDTDQHFEPSHQISLMIAVDSAEKVLDIYEKLSSGGKRLMEPESSFFAEMYGWVQDKFGISWQIMCHK